MRLLFRSALILTAFLLCSSYSFALEAVKLKVEWQPESKAAYYLLVLETTENKVHLLKTSHNQIRLNIKPKRIGVWAYDNKGNYIGRPEKIQSTDLLLKKKKEEDMKLAEQKRKLELEKTEKTKQKQPQPTEEEIARQKTIKEIEEEEKSAFNGPVFKSLITDLGIGSESLKAEGGSSSFDGSTGFLAVQSTLTIDSRKLEDNGAFAFYLTGHFHNFTVTEEESFSQVQGQKLQKSLERYFLGGRIAYFIVQSPFIQLAPTLGFQYIYVPFLSEQDSRSTNRKLDSSVIGAAHLGLNLELPLSEWGLISAELSVAPKSFSKVAKTYKKSNMLLSYKKTIFKQILAGVFYEKESSISTYQLECSSLQASCVTTGKTTLSSAFYGISIGLNF